jgi:hypothetical protein
MIRLEEEGSMHFGWIVSVLVSMIWADAVRAQTSPDIQQIADTMVRLCVGGGRTQAVAAGGSAGADISVRSLDVTGKLRGQFTVNESNVEGLVKGIDNALTQVAADQADKVRNCLQPVRERLLDIMLPETSIKPRSDLNTLPQTCRQIDGTWSDSDRKTVARIVQNGCKIRSNYRTPYLPPAFPLNAGENIGIGAPVHNQLTGEAKEEDFDFVIKSTTNSGCVVAFYGRIHSIEQQQFISEIFRSSGHCYYPENYQEVRTWVKL